MNPSCKPTVFALTSLLFSCGAAAGAPGADDGNVCSNTAKILRSACSADTFDNYRLSVAACLNIDDEDARASCFDDAREARAEDAAGCGATFDARRQVCRALGQSRYDPEFGAAFANNFVDPREIGASVLPNPYFPLLPGSEWKYKSTYTNDDGEKVTERDTVTVTGDTKLIEGVTCLVIKDVVRASDGTVEDTQDWFAQDQQGNVWYCGEIAQQKEIFEGDQPAKPELVGIEGSWKTGVERAKPGFQMLAAPKVAKTYRQELKWGDAEDVAEVLSLNATESVGNGAFSCDGQCLETRDFSALEPDAEEHKYYLPGVGLMLEVDLANGARNELISYTHP